MNIDIKIRHWPAQKQGGPENADPLAGAYVNAPSVPSQLPVTTDPLAGAMTPVRPAQPQQESSAVRRLRERLADLREDFTQIPGSAERMSRTRVGQAVEKLQSLIQKAQRLVRDMGGQEDGAAVAQILAQATELRGEMQARLYEILSGYLSTASLRRSEIRDGMRWIQNDLPLTDEQKDGLMVILDRREAELEAGPPAEGNEPDTDLDFVSGASYGVMIFINRDPALEDAAIAALQTEWRKIGEAGRAFMEGVLQIHAQCGEAGERAAVDAVVDAQHAAEASVEAAGVAAGMVSPQRLEEERLVPPTERNIMEIPQNVEICGGHGTLSGGVSRVFVYTGELYDAEPPATMEAFHEAILYSLGEGLEQLIFDMRQAGYVNGEGSMEMDFQLYIGNDGRIRTVVASYEVPGEDVAQIYQDFAQHMSHDISRQVIAPLYMSYYRARVQFVFVDENKIYVNIVE